MNGYTFRRSNPTTFAFISKGRFLMERICSQSSKFLEEQILEAANSFLFFFRAAPFQRSTSPRETDKNSCRFIKHYFKKRGRGAFYRAGTFIKVKTVTSSIDYRNNFKYWDR